MKLVVTGSIICLVYGIFIGLLRLQKCKRFIKEDKKLEKSIEDYKDIVLVIPVYNEQNVIQESFLYFKKFMNLGIKVIYVATKKEEEKITTYMLLEELVKEYKVEKYCELLLYPYKEGVMAHQLNYALKHIDENKIVVIYNVDSKPNINAINYILQNKDKLDSGVFQQYSYSKYVNKENYIRNAKMWQNRWSLAYELPRTIKGKFQIINKFNYVIGHGLAIRRSMFDRIGFFPENQINEDNAFGYIMSEKRIQINPIPYLEEVGFASDLSVLIRQQSVWFNGPLYAFRYFRELCKKVNRGSRFRLLWVACQNFKNALNWIVFPYIVVISFIYLLMSKALILANSLLFLTIVYVNLINKIAENILFANGYIKIKNKQTLLFLINEVVFWLFIHSFGPLITLFKILLGVNTQKNKYKTEKCKM